MSLETWVLFCVTETALCLTPGTAVLLVVSLGLTRGRAAALRGSAGVLTANACYFLLSATGIGAAMLASYDVFFAIKWLGAAYLIWLGVRTWRSPSGAAAVRPSPGVAVPGRVHPFVHGLVTQGANPKLLAFFAAIVPQFIDPARSLFPQLAILGVSSIVIEWFVLAAYGTLADGSGHLLRRPRFATAVNRIGGTLLIGAGLGLAGLRRSA